MGSIGSIKDILSVKIKVRHDGYTDQFCRIFMSKMFVISALVMGVDFFSDKVSCIVPKDSMLGGDFVHSACWIQGFYIYTELRDRFDESSYYGIPRDIDLDGIDDEGRLCQRHKRGSARPNDNCKAMHKTYYLQFQWMPFFVASLALMYYFPYLLFRIVNTDIISLKSSLKGETDTDAIVKNYFNYKINSKIKMRIRVMMNVFIKLSYVLVCITGFWLLDKLLNGNYFNYGNNWIKWTKYNNSMSHDIKMRQHPKPGNVLLPPMGFCDIHESTKDNRQSFHNVNKFVCEISPNILYQYVLIILWFLIVFSIIVSLSGLCISLVGHLVTITCFLRHDNPAREIYRILTTRECEYLEMIRRHNIPLFGEVVRQLQIKRSDCLTTNSFDHDTRLNNIHNFHQNIDHHHDIPLLANPNVPNAPPHPPQQPPPPPPKPYQRLIKS